MHFLKKKNKQCAKPFARNETIFLLIRRTSNVVYLQANNLWRETSRPRTLSSSTWPMCGPKKSEGSPKAEDFALAAEALGLDATVGI